MGKIKVTRKELKQDELRNFGLDVLEFVRARSVLVVGVLGGLLILFAGAKIYQAYRARVLKDSNLALTQVMGQFNQATRATDAEGQRPLLERTIALCDQLRTRFPETAAARQVQYIAVVCQGLLGQYDQASAAIQPYIEEASSSAQRARGFLTLGYLLENQYYDKREAALLDQADGYYQEAAREGGGSYLTYEAFLCQARVLELMNRPDEAVALYRRIISERGGESHLFSPRENEGSDPRVALFRNELRRRIDLLRFVETAQLHLDRLTGGQV